MSPCTLRICQHTLLIHFGVREIKKNDNNPNPIVSLGLIVIHNRTIHIVFISHELVTPPILRSILCPSLPSSVLVFSCFLPHVIFYFLPLLHIPTYLVQLVHNPPYDSFLYEDLFSSVVLLLYEAQNHSLLLFNSLFTFLISFKHEVVTIIQQVNI